MTANKAKEESPGKATVTQNGVNEASMSGYSQIKLGLGGLGIRNDETSECSIVTESGLDTLSTKKVAMAIRAKERNEQVDIITELQEENKLMSGENSIQTREQYIDT